jgi:hypothetical protein
MFLPLPKTSRNGLWQTMAQLSNCENNLTPMVRFVCHEIGHEVQRIGRDIAPWYLNRQHTPVIDASGQQFNDALVAPFECSKQSSSSDTSTINTSGNLHCVLFADHLDPRAPRIMDMAGNHTDCPLWGTWNSLAPQVTRKILEEELSDSIAGSPGG